MNFIDELDKRSSIRFSTELGLITSLNGRHHYSTLRDVSDQGVGFVSSNDFKVGEIILMTFEKGFGGNGQGFSIIIEILRCIHKEGVNHLGAKIRSDSINYEHFVEDVKKATLG